MANMKNNLYQMLKASAKADEAKALLTLDLLSLNAAGIGDHSTGDYYKNAEEALVMLTDAKDKLETLENWFLNSGPQQMV